MDTNTISTTETTAQQTPPTVGGSGEPTAASAEPEKKYTQTDMDAAIERRLARERKGMPSQEELAAFRTWKDSQQTEQQRQQRILDERNGFEQRVTELETQLAQAQNERMLLSRGVPAEDVDYYAYKIGKMVSDSVTFEQAADSFLRERPAPARTPAPQQGVRASFSAPMGGNPVGESLAERINRQLRGG